MGKLYICISRITSTRKPQHCCQGIQVVDASKSN
jgi:hypothetical protein